MKKFKLVLSLLIAVITVFSVFTISVSAADTTLHCTGSVEIGNQVTVTVNMQPHDKMLAVMCTVNYNEEVLTYVSGATSGGAGSLKILLDDPNGVGLSKYTATLTFSTKAVGSSDISVSECVYTYIGSDGAAEKDFTGASAKINVTDKVLSGNADLKKLSLSKGSLSPKFSAANTEYTATVPYETSKLSIYATASDGGAKVAGSGVKTLQVGANNFEVKVTAPNGTIKTYKITITRSQEEVSQPEASTPETTTPEENPFEALIDGNSYTVATDISGITIIKGFTIESAEYNEQTVSVAVDAKKEYTIYYLSAPESQELLPYTYDVKTKSFKRVYYISQGEYDYIVAEIPANKTLPDNFKKAEVKIGENTYNGFTSTDKSLSEFSYLYCFADGEYSIYRYDSKQNVLQRYPEIELINTDSQGNSTGFISRFNKLSTNGKVIVLGVVILALGFIALIVLFFINIFKKKTYNESLDYDNELDFDEFSVEDGLMAEEDMDFEEAEELSDDQPQDD